MTSTFQLEKSTESDGGVALDSGKPSPAQMLSVLSHGLPSLHRYAYRLLGNKDDAEDAVQEALLAAFKHLNQFRGQAQLSTWLTAIVINCARMQLRKRSRHLHVPLDSRIGEEQEYSLSDILVDGRPNPEDEYHKSWLNARLRESAARLSPSLRRTFHLRYVDHLSICETARVLGVPIGTVKAQTARARAKLLKVMRGLLHQRPAGRKPCSPRRPHQIYPAVTAIKPEATSFYSRTPMTSGGTNNALTSRGKKSVRAPREEQYGTAAVFENLYGNK